MPKQYPALRPTTDYDVAAMVGNAISARTSLEIVGGGTRSGLGRPTTVDRRITLDGLTGITLYEPAELVIGARAGTPLREIEHTLAEKGQMLPFEPMDHRGLFGTAGEPTIAGVFAGNLSGPRRISAGAARDHLLGVTLVNGRAQLIKNGGRVMKNVTGLDLVKLNAGAMGTLGILTEVIFKVLPAPEYNATLVFAGQDIAGAAAIMSRAMGSPFEIAAAAHLPGEVLEGGARTLLRLEGFPSSIRYRLSALQDLLSEFGNASVMDGQQSGDLWRAIRDVEILDAPADAEIWRVGVAPSKAPSVVAALAEIPGVRYFLDWAGGLIWIAAPASAGFEDRERATIARLGGYAMLVRASDERRLSLPVYQPLAAPQMTLTRGLKHSFDPDRIFNPGRMYEGI